MSANNYILIQKKDKYKKFVVTHRDFESNKVIDDIGVANNALQALKFAEGFILNCDFEVEYGIRFKEGKKK